MQSKRALIMLIVAVLAGIASVVWAAIWMGQKNKDSRLSIVVAAQDIQAGQSITTEMLQTIAWPRSSLPQKYFSDPKEAANRVPRVGMFKGDPVIDSKLMPKGTQAGLDSIIKAGYRAITIKVNEVAGVAGFVNPGSYVDIIANVQQSQSAAISKVVAEKVLVLAIAQEANRPEENKPKIVNAVTLEVTPEQAEKIDFARNVGSLALTLRNQVDAQATPTQGAQWSDAFGETHLNEASKLAQNSATQSAPTSPAQARDMPARATPNALTSPARVQVENQVEVIRGTADNPI